MYGRRVFLAAVVLLVAGCAGPTPAAQPPSYNDTDVMFLQMMLAHHEPAAKLLALGEKQASAPEVTAVATEIATTQAAEAATIRDRLASWDEPLVSTAHAGLHEAHGGLPLLDDAELLRLAGLTGGEFDTTFLTMLIGHQHGAVELARMETASGVDPPTRELATRTDETVRTQIQQLLRMVS
ncbi:DUF305 domain-containing protein [Asanoa ishikariensis]|uniref:Uncharacterized conserved protein, DUF305 family n=1 Tax=Asanoa ishikariensis TaxID=137265 RepID=A0A1H3MXQ8_9ACTN|nr:DUF305 domain-containing protein [Asanoa ishikariensis]GIF68976.1 DUF305 domain-containing protein [Asanoa ishikariensis]SDY81507.1 Uncharacterized conserved protein, DUF305 family [Asanoa ishikariensis]